MRKIKIALLALTLAISGVNAQTTSIDNVLGLRSAKSTGEIFKNEKLVGYYVFYFKEKVDKKNTAYEIKTYDDNYNPVSSFEIVRPKNTAFIEMSYNGSAFMMHFLDRKTGYEFVTYDSEGEKMGSYVIPLKEISTYDLQRVNTMLTTNSAANYIYAVGDQGFMRSTFSKNKKMGYELLKLDNNCKKVWQVESPEDSKLLESLDVSDVSEKITVGMITRRKSALTKSFDVFGVIIDTETGKVMKEIEMGSDEKGRRSMLKSFISDENETVSVVGEFYAPNKDIVKDKSAGLYIQEFNFEGEENATNMYKWKGDFDKFKQKNLSEEDKKEEGDNFFIFFHNIVQTKSGKIILVGEQFKKQVSAGGVALKTLAAASGGNSDVSAFEIRIGNMIVIELDAKRKLTGYTVVSKKKTSVLLQEGSGFISSMVLGHMVKSMGSFDYAFTASDYDNDKHDIVYIDANRKEEKGSKNSDLMVGVISINNGEMVTSRTAINSETNYFWFQQAKTGYISISEYFRKDKRLEFRLEPISY